MAKKWARKQHQRHDCTVTDRTQKFKVRISETLKCNGNWIDERVENLLCYLITSCPMFEDCLKEARTRTQKDPSGQT